MTSFETLVDNCNSSSHASGVRHFQKQLAETGFFTVTSPLNGNRLTAKANYFLPSVGVIYWFEDDIPFCLLSSGLQKGYPITAVAIGTEILPFGAESIRKPALEERALQILAEPIGNICQISDRQRTSLVVGDKNFAHFLWNEFPIIHESITSEWNLDVLFMFDPFGLIDGEEVPKNWAVIDDFKTIFGWCSKPLLAGGSFFCPAAARDDLLKRIGCVPKQQHRDAPCVYISLRPSGRTLEGQVEFIKEIIRRFRVDAPQAKFVLDGFSYPEDFSRSAYASFHDSFETRCKNAKALADDIICSQSKKTNTIVDITGLSLIPALKIIRNCTFYVTHSGTHQHKIAWLFGQPGFMHGNQSAIRPAAVRWLSLQVEDALPPAVPEKAHIEDGTVKDMPNTNARNKNYRLTNLEAVLQSAVFHFKRN